MDPIAPTSRGSPAPVGSWSVMASLLAAAKDER